MVNVDFGMEQVTRYLRLLDRRMYIVMHSGADWKPEYEQELEEIDNEISVLREQMDPQDSDPDAPKEVPPFLRVRSRKGGNDITLVARMKIVGRFSTVDDKGIHHTHELIRVSRLTLDGTPYAVLILYSTATRNYFISCLYDGLENPDYRQRRPFADDYGLAVDRAMHYLRQMQKYVQGEVPVHD